MTKEQVSHLFNDWNKAISTGDAKKVTSLYACNATLLPTISNQVRHNHDEIEDYFVQFLETKPQGRLEEENIRIYNDIATNAGIYVFTLKGGLIVKARFSFVYQLQEGEWKIIEHHSSRMPESDINDGV